MSATPPVRRFRTNFSRRLRGLLARRPRSSLPPEAFSFHSKECMQRRRYLARPPTRSEGVLSLHSKVSSFSRASYDELVRALARFACQSVVSLRSEASIVPPSSAAFSLLSENFYRSGLPRILASLWVLVDPRTPTHLVQPLSPLRTAQNKPSFPCSKPRFVPFPLFSSILGPEADDMMGAC